MDPAARTLNAWWNLARFVVFILLAVHLGWSWWLLALLFVIMEMTFT